MLIAKGQLDRPELVEPPPIEPQILVQSFEDKRPLVHRDLCVSRHLDGVSVVDFELLCFFFLLQLCTL